MACKKKDERSSHAVLPRHAVCHSGNIASYALGKRLRIEIGIVCHAHGIAGSKEKNMIRIGDEMAAVLSQYGISVLHDRQIHDTDYNSAYDKSYSSAAAYLEQHPSISFVLDVHRDAISDAEGRQYKVVSQEDPRAAQVSIVMGSSYDSWMDNLRLAAAVQGHLLEQHPTLMRPIILRYYGYNQSLSTGSMLVEIGAAGNSLDEAVYAARLFAAGFAETVGAASTT